MKAVVSVPPDEFYDTSRNKLETIQTLLHTHTHSVPFREFTREAGHILELLKFARCVIRRRVCTPYKSAGAFQALAVTHKIYQRGTPEGERAFFFQGKRDTSHTSV